MSNKQERIAERTDCNGITSYFVQMENGWLVACAEIVVPGIPGPENCLKAAYTYDPMSQTKVVNKSGVFLSGDDNAMINAKNTIHRTLKLLQEKGYEAVRNAMVQQDQKG